MAKGKNVGNEWTELDNSSAVADLLGRRQGRVGKVLRKGVFQIRWSDGEVEVLPREALRARYTTQSVRY